MMKAMEESLFLSYHLYLTIFFGIEKCREVKTSDERQNIIEQFYDM